MEEGYDLVFPTLKVRGLICYKCPGINVELVFVVSMYDCRRLPMLPFYHHGSLPMRRYITPEKRLRSLVNLGLFLHQVQFDRGIVHRYRQLTSRGIFKTGSSSKTITLRSAIVKMLAADAHRFRSCLLSSVPAADLCTDFSSSVRSLGRQRLKWTYLKCSCKQ